MICSRSIKPAILTKFPGATAIQIVPALAKIAGQVVVFQRSPNWVTPRDDSTIPLWRRTAYRYLPFVRRKYRASLMDVREAYWEVLTDVNGEAHKSVKSISAQLLNSQLPGDVNADLRQVLTPNYPPGCKRILVSDDYYPALGQRHVTLETAPIVEVTANGIRVSAGWNSTGQQHEPQEHYLDVIVCATGFKATQFLTPIQIEIAGQDSLMQRWQKGAYAYKGMTVPGLPNFAMMYGPNTNLGHNSIILMIEAQSAYINRLIDAICTYSGQDGGDPLQISPRQSVTEAYNRKVQASLSRSTLASNQCSSWYKSDDGLITTNWSENVVEYQRQVSTIDWNDFDLQGSSASKLRADGPITWPRVVEETQPWSSRIFNLSSLGIALSLLAAASFMQNWKIALPLLG